MQNLFVPYEQALELKQLKFDEPCFCLYDSKIFKSQIIPSKNSDFKYTDVVQAPLYQQAFTFFREKYDLVHTVYSNASGYMWELHYNQEKGGTHICDSGESGDCEMSGMFTTYEKAELECLKKLIEIVKQK